MKRPLPRLLAPAALLLPLLCGPAAAAAPERADDDAEKAVRKVLADQQDAWNKGDLEGFMKGYWASDDLTFFSGGEVTRGWKATLERYRKRYQADGKEMGTLTFSEVDVTVLGPDAAVVRGHFKVKLSKEEPSGLFTLVFKKLPDGWRIVHDHTSK
jgi:beta-aspartyl-peptidase (threonine type)